MADAMMCHPKPGLKVAEDAVHPGQDLRCPYWVALDAGVMAVTQPLRIRMKILYLCPDLGIPVLGRKGASTHVRELIAAFGRAGHSVVLVAPVLNRSPWERPAPIDAIRFHLPPGDETRAAVVSLKAFNETLGIENSLPGELRRILYNMDLTTQLRRRFEISPPDFIYERASLYATAGASVARELGVPLRMHQSFYALVVSQCPGIMEESRGRPNGSSSS